VWTDVVFERFCERSPFSVMTRATFERLFSDEALDRLFEEKALAQYHRQLAFSDVAALLTQVVLRVRPSLRNAYREAPVRPPATLKAVYEKAAGVEPAVCSALVERVAEAAGQALAQMPGSCRPDPVPGLRLLTFDGNHLAGTQKRLKPLRGEGAAALPGMSVVARDDRTGLLSRLACSEDAYTSERALAGRIAGWVRADDLVVADRYYCFFSLLRRLIDKDAFFVVRHHPQVVLTELSELRHVGTSRTGEVYEQEVEAGPRGRRVRLRRVVVRLFEPTPEGETEVRLPSNVPADKADALLLAEVYLRRWRVEHSFQELTEQLRCEVDTLGYPKAALFGFGLAVCAYNLLAVLKGALAAVHGQQKVEAELSAYEVAQDVSQDGSGLDVALPAWFWSRFARMGDAAFAGWLIGMARRVDWDRYKKARRSPPRKKGPGEQAPPRRKGGRRRPHVSTARVLLEHSKMSQ
jgi:hypothetical protein